MEVERAELGDAGAARGPPARPSSRPRPGATSAPAAASAARIALRPVGQQLEGQELAAVARDERAQHDASCCRRCARRSGVLPARQQLVAGHDEAHARAAHARDASRRRSRRAGPRPAAAAGGPRAARSRRGGCPRRRRRRSCAAGPPRAPRRRRRARAQTSAITTASAPSGSGAPVMMRTASPAPTAPAKGRPGSDSPTSAQRQRVVVAGAEGVLAAHRVAVHRGAREARHVHGRA